MELSPDLLLPLLLLLPPAEKFAWKLIDLATVARIGQKTKVVSPQLAGYCLMFNCCVWSQAQVHIQTNVMRALVLSWCIKSCWHCL